MTNWRQKLVVTEQDKRAKCDCQYELTGSHGASCAKCPRKPTYEQTHRKQFAEPDNWKQHARRGEFKIGLGL